MMEVSEIDSGSLDIKTVTLKVKKQVDFQSYYT